jgi:hypothetical protein
MEEVSETLKLVDLPGQLLDKIVEVLAKVGIDLPALILQGFLLVLVLLTLYVAVRPLREDWRNPKPVPLLIAATIALIAIGIVFGIVSQALLPDSVTGRVIGTNLSDVRVELLDQRGEVVSMGGSVDTQTGEFAAYYNPLWYGPARVLRITAVNCNPREYAISRNLLHQGVTAWNFTCEKP